MNDQIRDDGYMEDSPPCSVFSPAGPRRQPRYDMGPVFAQLPPDATITAIARKTAIPSRQLWRWMREGVPFWAADRLATRLYRTPGELWPEWDRGEGSPVIIDWTERRQRERAERLTVERARQAAVRATLPPPDLADIGDPYVFSFDRPKTPRLPVVRGQRGVSADLVYIFPEWLANSPNPPGLPPRKEAASCLCSTLDDLGRPVFIGRCGDNCERRPR